jgi:hypothetical protein
MIHSLYAYLSRALKCICGLTNVVFSLVLLISTLTYGQTLSDKEVLIDKSPELVITVTPTWMSEFNYRGRMVGGSSFMVPIDLNYGNFSYEIWAASDLSIRSNQEIDYSANYSINLGGDILLKPGITIYTYPKQDSEFGFYNDYNGIGLGYYSSELEPNVALEFNLGDVHMAPQIAYDRQVKSTTYELNADYDYKVSAINSKINFFVTIGQTYVANASLVRLPPRVIESFSYYTAGFLVPYKLAKHFTIKAGWQYDYGSGYVKREIRPVQYLKMPLSSGAVSVQIEANY